MSNPDHTHPPIGDISCEDVLKQLVDYLHGEVDERQFSEIEKHLDSCRSCFSRAEFETALRARVKDETREEIPGDVKGRLNSLLDKF